jgi:hypothetical protein
MASKRTMCPFYGKAERRLEKELSLVQARMRAAGATASDVSAMIQYGETLIGNKRANRAKRHLARCHGLRRNPYAVKLAAEFVQIDKG